MFLCLALEIIVEEILFIWLFQKLPSVEESNLVLLGSESWTAVWISIGIIVYFCKCGEF